MLLKKDIHKWVKNKNIHIGMSMSNHHSDNSNLIQATIVRHHQKHLKNNDKVSKNHQWFQKILN